MLAEATRDPDHRGLDGGAESFELGPLSLIEAFEGPAADERERSAP
jgi:hypothetical protein